MTSRRAARAALYLGTAAVVFALSKVHAAWVAVPPYDFTDSSRLAWALTYIAMLAAAAYAAGLPDLPRDLGGAELSAMAATGTAALAMSAVQLIAGDALLPRFVVIGSALVLTLWYMACVALAAGGRVWAEERDQVVIVAGAAEESALEEDLRAAPEHPAQIVGVLRPEAARPLGDGRRPLVEMVKAGGATVLVLDRVAQTDEAVVVQAAALHEQGVRIRTLSLFYEQWLGKLPIGELERVSLLFDIGEIHGRRYARLKRLVDVTLAVPGCAVLIVAVPFVALGNLVGNRGSLFFRQVRTGRNAEPFDILKFRTMREGPAPGGPATWTAERDPRITPFGQLLRLTHLDELPQMLNILRGDLSFVGPRPEQPHYVAELVQKLPFYDLRHLVRPGLTGWAQVKYGYAANEADALHKLQYEFYYLRHQSLAFDLRIIGRTLRSVLGLEGGGR
jgi:lipopolysaccharide/colanic/teichoic acid biosynthesis glycosyltransferase